MQVGSVKESENDNTDSINITDVDNGREREKAHKTVKLLSDLLLDP